MPESKNKLPALLLMSTLITASCGNDRTASSAVSAVAADVQFLVLGKMSLFDQSATGELALRSHHFVAEIMPKSGREIVGGTLTSSMDPDQVLQFAAEGNAFLAHGARVMDPQELHRKHPDGEYVFSYETQSGRMVAQALTLTKRATIDEMPAGAVISLQQHGTTAMPVEIDPDVDLLLTWEQMLGNTRIPASELDDLVFVLAFDCFGNNVFHSGRPYQDGPYLTYKDAQAVIPESSLEPGLNYTVIVEQATADVKMFRGVPGISTYATLTFVELQATGQAAGSGCPIGTE